MCWQKWEQNYGRRLDALQQEDKSMKDDDRRCEYRRLSDRMRKSERVLVWITIGFWLGFSAFALYNYFQG